MIDHLLGRPSTKSRRLQVLAVLAFWTFYLSRGDKHGPPGVRFWSRLSTRKVTTWQTVVITMIYLYAARNFSTLVGLASPEPMSNMYNTTYFRATWMLTALDAGFWTAMKIRTKWLRDLSSVVFSVFYLFAAERADEKVRKVRGNLTVDHLRVAWNKGTTPYLRFFQNLLRPRFMKWPPRQIRIHRPPNSDYKDPIAGWLYYDGPLKALENVNKLVLNIPGGGFVAMDPRCNDDMLLCWAAKTGLPILSLDYKKAPEYPYPYALNECYDAYASIVKTRGTCIGMSGNEVPEIVLAGDSAGGNLATATALMIIERNSTPMGRMIKNPLPVPTGMVLFYPALDMNIGNWMTDEQMSLIRDRRTRRTNRPIIRRKSMQYNDLVGTPHQSEDEEEPTPPVGPSEPDTGKDDEIEALPALQSPHPEYAHGGPTPLSAAPPALPDLTKVSSDRSYHPQPLKTRLATSSMISYFNDRVLTPEMMRAMIILYIGPHNRPDFTQDYLLSPVLAPDSLLAEFPKTYFLTGERDPLVDDTVIFAGRLRRVKERLFQQERERRRKRSGSSDGEGLDFNAKDVAEVVLIPGVSHGFLQFPALYPPAWKLFERAARWIDDIYADADVARDKEAMRGRVRAAAPVNGLTQLSTRFEDGAETGERDRHHVRTESSGDEDKPLEISMTKLNRGRAPTLTDAKSSPPKALGPTATEKAAGEGGAKAKKRNGRARANSEKDKQGSLIKLNSSDDLLGRRMQGLVGGLTGLHEDD